MTGEPDPTMVAADRQVMIIGAGVFLILALLAFIPDVSPSGAHGLVSERAHARIESITPATDQSPPLAEIVFVDGSRAGQRTEAQVEGPSGQLQLPDYQAGDEVVVALDTDPDGNQATAVIDRWRLPVLEYLVGAFAIVTIIVAGWRGIRALVSLALTLVLAVKLLIPLLLAGWNPVGLAISLGTLITIASLLLTQGFTRATLAAVLGTAIALAATGVLAVITTQAARFTTAQGSEQIVYLQQLAGDRLDLSGLLLAAVIFGGLGVLNDVAISQAATVEELHAVSPSMSRRELYTRTMNVGIAHLGATVNTLVFAYLGAALPLLVLLALQIESVGLSVNEEIVAVEVVRTIVGSIGILLAVPITTAIACWLAVRSTEA
ncbi:MAG TPA: YibE/F family protein [Candidatus Dormibacteraeota bacterium]|nr:YibE/F family protein [Candidatus Dormibacteraeota bacterium]